ncbi:MAG: hypothetical protein EOP83_23840 [Verrucomicrobiaceae bacterium]|nr:MAG: hypothetical protein EOP83_23840 [Verrucomicrobiaceae bacterium]
MHKRFPFELEVRFADKEKRDEIDEYLRTSLGPEGQDWLRPRFSTYFFTKRDFSAQIAFRFRGTQ